jgi:hypothetical protein
MKVHIWSTVVRKVFFCEFVEGQGKSSLNGEGLAAAVRWLLARQRGSDRTLCGAA